METQYGRARGGIPWLGLGPLLLGVSACNLPQVGSANLDALHDDEGDHRYVASTMTGYQYVLSQLVPRSLGGLDQSFLAPTEHAIENPSAACLDNLLVLAAAKADTPAFEAAQVRHFAWLALRDPSLLSRERALLELGHAAARLKLGAPSEPPKVTAGPVELSEALVALVDALRPLLERLDNPEEADVLVLREACQRMSALPVDLEGGRRVLRAIENVSGGLSGHEPALAALFELSAQIQGQVLRRVLSEALADSDQRVRAAAIEANWRAYGAPFLLFQLLELESNFLRRGAWRYATEDVVHLLGLVRTHGLPLESESASGRLEELRYRLLLLLTNIAISVGEFDERVRGAAMRALGKVSGADMESLRFEDWSAWWQQNDLRLRPAGGPLGEPLP